jgi:hypothetical protein
MHPIRLLSHSIHDAISNSNSDTMSETISETISDCTEAISKAIPNSNPEAIPDIHIAAHCFQKGGFGSGFVKQSASISAVSI